MRMDEPGFCGEHQSECWLASLPEVVSSADNRGDELKKFRFFFLREKKQPSRKQSQLLTLALLSLLFSCLKLVSLLHCSDRFVIKIRRSL